MARTDHTARIAAYVRDDVDAITDSDLDAALEGAVARYSKHRPRTLVEDLAAASRALALPASWDAALPSALVAIEYSTAGCPPMPRPISHWEIYLEPTRTVLRYSGPDSVSRVAEGYAPPADGESVRVTYTASHVVDPTTDTVPASDREAVAAWAAAELLDQLAARGAQASDTTIAADGVEHIAQVRSYRAIAKSHRDRYYELLGLQRSAEMRPGATSAVATMTPRRLDRGGSRLRDGVLVYGGYS